MLGDVSIIRETVVRTPQLVDPLIINKLGTKLSSVRHICCVNADKAWVCGRGPRVALLDKNGEELQTLKTDDVYGVGGLSVNREKQLLFCSQANKCVNRLNRNNKIEKIFSTNGYTPCGLHCCHDNDILVSLCHTNRAKVQRHDATGNLIQELEFKHNGRPFYKKPTFLTENSNGDICTSDQSMVVVVRKNGVYRYSYTGGKFQNFKPQGICTDNMLRMIIADEANNIVHVTDENGNMMTFLDTSGQGLLGQICKPLCVSLDNEDKLWIGELYGGFIKVLKYIDIR